MAQLPNDTNTNFDTYNGDVKSLLGTTNYGAVNSALGYDQARRNYNFINGGNIYRVGGAADESNAPISYIDSVANRQQSSAQAAAKTAMDTKFGQDKNDITDFLGRYKTGVQGAIDSTSSKYQLPQQLDVVNALNTRIQDLKTNFSNTGANGYANAGQVDAAINSRYLPQYTTSMTNLTNSAGLAQSERDALTQPYQTEATMLNDRMARELSGFTSEQQRELDGYIAKLQSNTTLSAAQIDAANKLAVAQKQYQQAIDQQKLQNQNVIIPNQTGSGTYYNPATGTAYNPFVK